MWHLAPTHPVGGHQVRLKTSIRTWSPIADFSHPFSSSRGDDKELTRGDRWAIEATYSSSSYTRVASCRSPRGLRVHACVRINRTQDRPPRDQTACQSWLWTPKCSELSLSPQAQRLSLRVHFAMEPIKTGISLSHLLADDLLFFPLPGPPKICLRLASLSYVYAGAAAVEDAIQTVASRDAVFFDPGARKWVSSIPGKAPIRTRFGEVCSHSHSWPHTIVTTLWSPFSPLSSRLQVKCMLMRSYDGTVICSHPGGTAYLSVSTQW